MHDISLAGPLRGNKLRTIRKNKGWTQEQMAVVLGVSVATVRNWEHGNVHKAELARTLYWLRKNPEPRYPMRGAPTS
jgi:transcriptional regulator with XRE-family HTH domain